MKKYRNLFFIIIAVIIIPAAYYAFIASEPSSSSVTPTGIIHNITIIAKNEQWRFDPETIEVEKGDIVKITAVNEDGFDHGFAIDAYGISHRLPAHSTTAIEIFADQEGDFPFYCSIPCGSGLTNGKRRSHFDMSGIMHVRSMISSAR